MPSTLKILGCSGGIGSDLRTTSFLLDDDILIDAGTGVGDLTLDELLNINHVFITHSHLDHLCSVPFMADSVGALRQQQNLGPLKIYGIPQTLKALQIHIFNNVIWPDFTCLPSIQHPFITLHPIHLGGSIEIDRAGNKRLLTALPVNHSIPAVAYAIQSDTGTLVFSGDTGSSENFINALNALPKLDHLLIETSFNDDEEALAKISGHLSPTLLIAELKRLRHAGASVWISHLKPGDGSVILDKIQSEADLAGIQKSRISKLRIGQKITF